MFAVLVCGKNKTLAIETQPSGICSGAISSSIGVL